MDKWDRLQRQAVLIALAALIACCGDRTVKTQKVQEVQVHQHEGDVE